MPDIEKITQAIAAIDANPEGKELNLTFGSKKVQRGEYLPRAGKWLGRVSCFCFYI